MEQECSKRLIKSRRISALAKLIAKLADEYNPDKDTAFTTAYRYEEMARTADELQRLVAGW